MAKGKGGVMGDLKFKSQRGHQKGKREHRRRCSG